MLRNVLALTATAARARTPAPIRYAVHRGAPLSHLKSLNGGLWRSFAASAERDMETLLTEGLDATHVAVVDVSGGCGSMYRVEVVSPQFDGMNMVKQHRLVQSVLAAEIADMHGLTITTMTPAQYKERCIENDTE